MFGSEELLAFIRRSIGVRDDEADEAGSLHAKIKDALTSIPRLTVAGLNKIVTASNNLKISNDSDVVLVNTPTPTKVKEIIILNLVGKIRVKFDLHSANGVNVFGKIFANGTELNSFTTYLDTWTTYSADISIKQGDFVQLYLMTSSSGSVAYARNFRLYYDVSALSDDAIAVL